MKKPVMEEIYTAVAQAYGLSRIQAKVFVYSTLFGDPVKQSLVEAALITAAAARSL